MIILPLLIWLSIQLIPLDVMEESKKEAKDLWENGYPKKMVLWYSDSIHMDIYYLYDYKTIHIMK